MEMRTLKSFRLYLGRGPVAPMQVVADYKPQKLARFRADFRPVAESYRRLGRIGYALFFLFAACILLCWAFPLFTPWLLWGVFASWLAVMLLALLSKVPVCPACHNALDQDIGAYCPECGAHALQPGDWLRVPWCSSCGRQLFRGKARHYTIRPCTHCGVAL